MNQANSVLPALGTDSVLRARFHDFQFEIQFLTTKDARQIELPKLSREAKRWPTLIEVHEELESQRAPQICETDVSLNGLQLRRSVKRKRRARRDEARERVTVEVIAMRWICGPIGIRIVRRQDL